MTDYYDSGREREFYTYYDAYRALSDSDPPFADLYDAEAASRHEPKLATDPTLTAFCQLGALRMNTKRCMIFFFDQTNGYVLAESTQSHHSGHAGELWLGASIIPRGLSVCEHTINIEEANYGSNKDSPNAGQVHIINDFLQDQRFCNRPYVKEGPRARFYCGVPIKTPSGANIGAYCALGEEPRDGVSDEDVDFMKHMGSLVMGHLSSLRRSAEYERGARMLQGLGVITRHDDESNSPIEGMAERIGDEASPSSKTSSSRRMPKYVGTYTPMLSEYASDYAAETDDQSEKRRNPRKQRAAASTNLKSEVFVNQAQQATEAEKEHANGPPPLGRAPKSSDSSQSTSTCHTDGNEPTNSLERQIKAKFQEASQLLLDAVKSDGVVFLDATFAKPPGDPTASRHFTGLGLSDRSTDVVNGQPVSLGATLGSAVPALPSPPLEISLEHLSLNSSDSTTVRSSVQPPSAGIYPQLVAAQQEDLVPASTHKNTASESTPAVDPLTLLLVDDNPINLKLLTMVADRSGFPRLLATNGKEAVDAYVSFDKQRKQDNQSTGRIPTGRPDVILLDLNMPIMDGYEAAQQIRQFEKREGIPRSVIVAITGLGDDIARAKAYQHGFNHFMSKPVRPQQLTDMLKSIIETKKRSREAEAVA